MPKWLSLLGPVRHVVKHLWTYPLEEFIALGAHGETGETELKFFFGFFWWPFFFFGGGLLFVALETGVYTLGFPGGIGNGGRDEPRRSSSPGTAWEKQAAECNLWQHHIKNR